MRQTALEGISHHVIAVAARESLDEHFIGAGEHRFQFLYFQPVANLFGQCRPPRRIGQHGAHGIGQVSGQRKLAAGISRYAGIGIRRAGDVADIFADTLEAQYLAGEQESVAGRECFQESLLDLAEHRAAAHICALATLARQPDLQHRHLDNGARIQPVLLGEAGTGEPPLRFTLAVFHLPDFCVLLIALECVAAGGNELDAAPERIAVERCIGRCAGDFCIEFVFPEWSGASGAQYVLRQHVQSAIPHGRAVLRADIVGVQCGLAFQHLEAVGGNEDGSGGFVHAVIGAADALRQQAGAFGRADMDDEIDITPVDAHVERRGGDHGAQFVFDHRLLNLAALADIERAVVQRDRQIVGIGLPQLLKQQFGLAPGVDEEQRGLVRLYRLHHLAHCVARRMA